MSAGHLDFTTDVGDCALVGRISSWTGSRGPRPRRAALDGVLVAPRSRLGGGAQGFPVRELVYDEARVGIRGGSDVVERGATWSARRQAFGAREWVQHQGTRRSDAHVLVLLVLERVAGEGLEIHSAAAASMFAFPTNDGLYAVFVAWPIDELERVRADIERELLAVVDGVPEFASASVRAGARSDSTALPASRTTSASRTAKGGRSSATPAATRTRTVRSASATPSATRSSSPTLADAALRRGPEEDALARYEAQRNEATLPSTGRTSPRRGSRHRGGVPRAAERLRGDDEATKRFYLAAEGLIEPRLTERSSMRLAGIEPATSRSGGARSIP